MFERGHDQLGILILCPPKCSIVMRLSRPKAMPLKCRGGKLAKESGCLCCPDYESSVDADYEY